MIQILTDAVSRLKRYIQFSVEHDSEAHVTVNICLNQQVDGHGISFFFFFQITGSVSRNCTSGGWSRPFPPYHVACSVDDGIPEVKTGGEVIGLKGQAEELEAGGAGGQGQWKSGKHERNREITKEQKNFTFEIH